MIFLQWLFGLLPDKQPRGCHWVALHFASRGQADIWLKEQATETERLDARQLMTGDRIRPCDIE